MFEFNRTPDGNINTRSLGFDFVSPEVRNFAGDLTGISNFSRAFTAGREGDWGTALRQGGAGALKAGSFFVPGGLAARGVFGTGKALKTLAATGLGAGMYGAGSSLAPASSQLQQGFSAQSQQAQAARLQGQADQFARDQYRQQQIANQQRAQDMQDQMVRNINASFTPEQTRSLQAMGQGYVEPGYLALMKQLSESQKREFDISRDEVRENFAELVREIDRARRGTEIAQRQGLRQASQAGSTGLADARASLARRGMLPATEGGVARMFDVRTRGQEAAITSRARSALENLRQQQTRGAAEMERFLGNINQREWAAEQDAENAYRFAKEQDKENWMRMMGYA